MTFNETLVECKKLFEQLETEERNTISMLLPKFETEREKALMLVAVNATLSLAVTRIPELATSASLNADVGCLIGAILAQMEQETFDDVRNSMFESYYQ